MKKLEMPTASAFCPMSDGFHPAVLVADGLFVRRGVSRLVVLHRLWIKQGSQLV